MRLQQRLGEQTVQVRLRHAGEDQVLVGGEADLAVAVGLRQPRRLDQVRPGHAADGDVDPDVGEPLLLLRVDADVVAAVALGEMLPGGSQRDARSRRQLGAERLRSQLLHQIAQAAGPAVVAVAQLVEELGDGAADLDRVLGTDEDVDVGGQARPVGEPAADQQVEPDRAVVEPGRDQRQIVDLRLGAILAAAGDAHLELARQVGVLAVAGEEVADRHRDRVGVDDLMRRRCRRPGSRGRCAPSRRRPGRW